MSVYIKWGQSDGFEVLVVWGNCTTLKLYNKTELYVKLCNTTILIKEISMYYKKVF